MGTTSIGIDLGGTNVRAGLVQDGQVIRSASARIAGLTSESAVLERICEAIEEVWPGGALAAGSASVGGGAAGNLAPGAIGIGVPSIVDPKRGIVYDTVNIPSWKKVHVKDILEAKYNIPVWVNNDANCFALGESYYGAGVGHHTLAGVTIGTGLGTGIILEGKLFNGAHCGAGEIGNIPYLDGCIETYASGQFFQHVHGQAGETLLALAETGDESARQVFTEYGVHLGHALLVIVYAYDPDIIVLGGSVSQAFPFFEQSMREGLAKTVFPQALKDLVVQCAQVKDIALLGASLLSGENQLF